LAIAVVTTIRDLPVDRVPSKRGRPYSVLDIDVAIDKLSSLETADEIAAFLIDQGVKAMPRVGTSCAIAQWLRASVETEFEIHVSSTSTKIVKVEPDGVCQHFEKEVPVVRKETIWQRNHTKTMRDFIQKFDEGGYPKLLGPNAHVWIDKVEYTIEMPPLPDHVRNDLVFGTWVNQYPTPSFKDLGYS
jgi:hypothetical protein